MEEGEEDMSERTSKFLAWATGWCHSDDTSARETAFGYNDT